jgi:hypothetical protein
MQGETDFSMIEERWMEDGGEWMASILNNVQIRARCLLQQCSCVSISKIFLPIHKAPHSNQIMMIRYVMIRRILFRLTSR